MSEIYLSVLVIRKSLINFKIFCVLVSYILVDFFLGIKAVQYFYVKLITQFKYSIPVIISCIFSMLIVKLAMYILADITTTFFLACNFQYTCQLFKKYLFLQISFMTLPAPCNQSMNFLISLDTCSTQKHCQQSLRINANIPMK